MINNLKLVTVENYGYLRCDFYLNRNDEILLTRKKNRFMKNTAMIMPLKKINAKKWMLQKMMII